MTGTKRRRALVAGTSSVLACLLLTACGGAETDSASSGDGGAPIEINAILSISGGAAFLGTGEMHNLEVLQDTVNADGGIDGREIKFNFLDDKSTPAVAVQLARGLIDDGVHAFVGPSLGATCGAVAPLIAEKGPVSYCLSPVVHPPKDSYQFSAAVGSDSQFDSMANYFRSEGWTKIAYIAATDVTGQDGKAQFERMLAAEENSELEAVTVESYELTDTSVAAQAARIAESDPDVVIAWTSGTSFGTVLNGLDQAGVTVPVITSNANMTLEQMDEYEPFAPSSMLFSVPEWPNYALDESGPTADARKEWVDALADADYQPNATLSLSQDAGRLIIDALKAGADSADAIQDHINGLSDFPGVFGAYDFTTGDQRGITIENVIVAEWDKDERLWTPVSGPAGEELK
ncbi:MAG: receptor ligand binding region family protein [Blastococcus sp.]|nr:receptor ligand binding region family protein [Blastococcus sp.]